MTTQIVILAAGMGSRLGRSLPKPLTELNDGRSIMQQQFDNIHQAFGADVSVTSVVGYKLEHIVEAFPDATYVYNERYDQTNTSKSLLRALQASKDGGVLWMNGDVVFDPEALVRAGDLVARDQSFVSVNTAKVSDEEVKYTTDANGHIRELSKTVVAGDEVDADGLAEPADHGLGELLDVAVRVGRVLDLLVGHLRGVDADERTVGGDEVTGAHERFGVEHDVAVHPQHAAVLRRLQGAQQGLAGVGLVVALVVDERRLGEGLDDVLELVADDDRDLHVGAEGLVDVVELLLHDAAAVAEFGERLRQRAAESAAHARREDHDLSRHGPSP